MNDSSENDDDMDDDEQQIAEDYNQLNGYLGQDGIKQEIKTEEGYESSTSSSTRKLEEDFETLSRGNSFSLNDVDNIFEGM